MSKINVTLGFDADTSQAQRRLNELVTSLRQLSAHPVELLDDTDLRDATKAAKELETHLHKAYNVDTQKLDLSKFSKSLSAAGQDLNYFQKNLSKIGVDGEKAFLNLAKAIATADAPTFRLSGHVKNLFDELVKVGRWQFTSSVMHNLTGAVQTAYHYAQDLNESLTNIRIVTGQSTEEMAQFADKANAAAKALSTTTVKYSDAALIYYQQGLDDQQIEERTAITIKMANAAGQSVETVSDQLTSIWNNYYDGSKSLEYYADVLARLGADTASSSDEITEGLEKFSSVADTVGLSYEYAASALATVTATTRESANIVGTAFKTLFSRIQGLQLGDTLDDGTDLNKYSSALASVGVNIKDTNGDLKEMDTILDEVGARWNVLSKDQQMALAQTVAGVRQYTQFIALMDNWDYFQENLNSALNATGSLGEQAEIYAEGWEAAQNRVRASAEGIYQALIDEDFFIGLTNGFASVLEGVDGLVTGLGGMKGILTSTGGIILSMYSKEIPSVITKLSDNFRILTGQATSAMVKIQKENIKMLNGGSDDVKLTKSMQMERAGLAQVAKLKQQLVEKDHLLSKAEKEQAEATIRATEASYNQVVALQQEAEKQEQVWATINKSNTNYLIDEYLALGKTLVDTEQKIDNLKSQLVLTEQTPEQYSKLKEQLVQLESMKITGLVDSFKQLEEVVGLTEDELRALGNYNPSKSLTLQAKEIQIAYEKLEKKIKDTKEEFEQQVRISAKLKTIREQLELQENSWKKINRSVEDAKKEIEDYLISLEQITTENPDLKLNIDTIELDELKRALEDPKISAENLKQSFLKFLEVLKTQGEINIEEFESNIDELSGTLVKLSGNTREAEREVEGFRETLEETEQTSFRAGNGFKNLNRNISDIGDGIHKTSEVLGNLTGSLMSLQGVLYSIREIKNIFDDEDASNLEKIMAIFGGIISITELAGNSYKFLDNATKKLANSSQGLLIAKGAETAGWKLNTAAIAAASKALIASPWFWIGAVILGVAAGLGIAAAKFKENAKAAKEAAKASNEQAENSKKQIESNTDLIRSMEEVLKAYKETGEGKEELDEITNSLAEAYDLEGAALAKLSGKYEDYQIILEKARKKQIEELENYRQDTEKAKDDQREALLYTAREGNGRLVNDQYKVTFGGIGDEEQKAEGILKRYLTGSKLDSFVGINTNSITTTMDFNTESIIQFYEELKQAKEEMDKTLTDEEIAASDIYKEASEWLDRMNESIETYKAHEQTIKNIDVKLQYSETNVDNYAEYAAWSKQVRNELGKTITDSEELEKVFQSIINLSTNSNLSEFQELESALENIKSVTQVSSEELDHLFNLLSKDESKWSKQTLLTLDWAHLTDETWESAANSLEEYYKAVEKVTDLQETKTKAKEVLDLIKDGIISDNSAKIQSVFDWGKLDENSKQAIIEYSDFLKLTLEEQQEYLTQFTETSLIGSLQNQIEYNTGEIERYKTYLKDSFNLDYNDIDSYLEKLGKLANFKNWAKDTSSESAYLLRRNEIAWTDFGFDGPVSFADIKNSTSKDGQKIQKLLDSYKEILNIKNKISNLGIANKDLEEQKKVEAYFKNNEAVAKRIVDQLKLDDIDFVLNPDDSRFQQVIDDIVNSDPNVRILIEGEMDESLLKLKEDTEAWMAAASMIGEDYQVAADNIDELAAKFPGILEGYEIVSGEMIRLNGEQVQNAIGNAEKEIEANRIKEANILKLRLETLKSEKTTLQEQLRVVERALGGEEKAYKILYALAKGYSKEASEDMENNAEEVTSTIDTENKRAAETYAKLYSSALQSYVEYLDKVEEYTRSRLELKSIEERFGRDSVQYQEKKESLRGEAREILSTYNTLDYSDKEQGKEPKSAEEYAKEYLDQNQYDFFQDQMQSLSESLKAQLDEKEKEIATAESLLKAIETQAEIDKNLLAKIGTGSGSGKNSADSTKEYKKEDLLDEVDIYQDINNEIDYINSKLDEQEKIISRTEKGSAEYNEALEEQKKLLDQLITKQQKKKEMAEKELNSLKEEILNSGKGLVIDNTTGLITNSVDILDALQSKINEKIIELNETQNEETRKSIEEEKEALMAEKESLEKLIQDYQTTIELLRQLNTAIAENEYTKLNIDIQREEDAAEMLKKAEEELEEARRKEEERKKENYNRLQKELELKIQIDENSLKKLDYYLDKLSDDFYQMAEAMEVMMKKVPTMENSLGNYENFYNKLQSAWTAGDINSDDYLEGLQQSYDGILDNLSSLVALDKEMIHYYEDTLAAAEEELSHYTDSLEHLTSVLEHYKNIIELVDGEYNFEGVDIILRGQAKTIENQIQVAESNYQLMLRQKEMAEEAIRGVDRDSAAWEVLNNKLQAATEAVNRAEEEMLNKTEEWAEAMKAVMENTFAEAAHNMEMAMTQGMGFDMLNGSLDRLSAKQDVYLTATNRIYEITKLMNTAQQAADKTDNIASKQKLNNYIKKIENLKDEADLSKLNLDIEKARYDVLLAEIALEEAQNAKSTVRLQRDSEGNFGYVYTSDTDAIISAEQDLANAQNKLYNIGLDATNEYGEKMLELQQKLSDDLIQLEQDRANGRFAIEGSYEAAKKQLLEEYYALFTAYSDQYTDALEVDVNIQEEAWINAYDSMINQTQNWADYTEEYTDICENAYAQWRDAVTEHNEVIQDVLNNTKEKVDDVTNASDNLKDEVLGEVLPAIEDELDMVADLSDNYAHLRDEILETIKYYEDLIDTIEELIRKQAEAKAKEAAAEYDISGVRDFSQAMADHLEIEGNKTTDGWYQALLKGREEKLKQEEYAQFNGEAATNLRTLMLKYERYRVEGVTNDLTEYVESIDRNAGEYFDPDEVRRLIATFASGGYTGSWGPSGRLAVLHQKELVLNANDTLHFLQAAEILRGVSEAIDLQAMANQIMLNPYAGALTSTLADQTLQQQVTIEANFPGVTDRFEIEEAFNNLINTASQYANRK